MARLELRDATIRIKDGFTGTGAIDDTPAGGDTTLEIDTVAGLPNSDTRVPVGARFTIAGVADTTFTVTAEKANKVFRVTVDATSGNFTLTFNGQVTANIAYDASAATVLSALEALSNVEPGDVAVTLVSASVWDVECTGDYASLSSPTLIATDVDLSGGSDTVTVATRRAGATTWHLTFTPAISMSDVPSDDDAITFLPQQIEVKIGDGNLTYTENKEYEYELDRGDLDTVREGNQVPMDINMDFVYEFVRTGTNENISVVDALKGIGGADEWYSTSSDPCEPYCVDLEIEHDPPCGSAETEITLFPDFRYDSLEFDLGEATISCTGRCNATEPTITRS